MERRLWIRGRSRTMLRLMSTGKRTGHEAFCGGSLASGSRLPRGGNGGRAGTGAALLLVMVVLVLALGAAAWTVLGTGGQSLEVGIANREAPAAIAEEPVAEVAPAEGPRAVSGLQAGPAGEYASMGRVFDGTGMILGEVQVDAGVPYPERWTLVLEPSKVAPGRDKAVTRRIESEPGQRDFELRDLPMASYRIRVEAEGLAASPQEIALFKVEGYEHMPGVNVVHATLRLVPIASVEGSVRQASGDMAPNLPVYLVDRRRPEAPRLETATDGVGGFRLDAVPSGAWLLRVGHPVRSMVTPLPVTVGLTSVAVDEVQLPPLATLEIEATDAYGRPYPGVEMVGYLRGSGSGSFRETTDAFGRVKIPYLSPGPWRVNATHAEEGQRSRMDLTLAAGDEAFREMNMR